MAKIPTIVAEQGLDTQRSTMPNINLDMSQYQAMQQLGSTISQVGSKFAAQYKAQQDKLQGYKTERAFQKFQNDVIDDVNTYEQEADPSGQDFYKNYNDRYEKHRTEFESQVPPDLLPEYQVKTEGFKGQVGSQVAQKEVNMRNTYYETTLNTDVDGLAATVIKNPDMSNDAWSTIQRQVDASGLSPMKKAERLGVYRSKINESTVQGYVKQGRFEEARDYIDHLGPAPSVIDKRTENDGKGKVVVYEHVDYNRVKPNVKSAISSVSAELGIPLRVTSGFRDLTHPAEARKGPKALHRHTTGTAVDLDMQGYDNATRAKVIKGLIARGATGLGVYKNSPNMIHVDWSGLGAGAKEGGVSTWYGEHNIDSAPGWFKEAYKNGLALRKQGVPTDVSPSFDTKLDSSQEAEFRQWKQRYAPNDSGIDYDLRGAFKAGLKPGKDGHWPDTFKKPNHPTFSNESIYAKNAPDKAGHWEGGKYIPPTKFVDVTPNTMHENNWVSKNYERWEFGGPEFEADTPVVAALDLMTSALGKKIPFKAKQDSIKLRLDSMPESQKQDVIAAAASSGFSGFNFASDEKGEYVTMRTDTQGITNSPNWLSSTEIGKGITSISKKAGLNAKFIPRGNPDADKLMKYIEDGEGKALKAQEDLEKQTQEDTAKAGWDLFRTDTLTDDWLEENRDNLSETDYRMLTTKIIADKKKKETGEDDAPFKTDQTTFVDLMKRATDPADTTVIKDAVEAQTSKVISKTDFNKIFDSHQKTMTPAKLGKEAPWKARTRRYVLDKIKPIDEEDTTYLEGRLEAANEFDTYLEEHPDATADIAKAQADAIIAKHIKSSNIDVRAGLDMGPLKVGRYQVTSKDITTAARQLQADRKAGTIDQATFNQQIGKLMAWKKLLDEEDKNGK